MNSGTFGRHKITPFNIANVEGLIRGQAEIHKTEFTGSITAFQKDLIADQSRVGTKVPLIHGYFFTSGTSYPPLGYTFFYPMFDKSGGLGFWGEDTFVDESARRKGMGTEIIRERIHQMFDAAHDIYRSYPPQFLDWVTAENNTIYHKFAKSLYGITDSRSTHEIYDGTKILENLQADAYLGEPLETKKIGVTDAYLIEKMNQNLKLDDHISPDFAAQSLHFPLIGFIVKRKGSDVPLAAMVTNTRYSTFRTQWDFAAQPVVFDETISETFKIQAMHSLFKALRDYKEDASKNGILNCKNAHFSLITKKGADESDFLKKHFELERLRLSDGNEKIAVPYRATLQVLEKRFGDEVRFVPA